MEEAAFGATVQVLLQNLLSASFDEIKLVWGFEEDLTRLKNSLLMIQDFVSDAEKVQFTNKSIKRWLEQLEDVAYEADAILDEFNYKLLRKKVKKQNGGNNKVLTFFSSGSSSLLLRRKMAHRIKNVNEKLEMINKNARSYGLHMTVSGYACNVTSATSPELQTDSFSIESNIVGRDTDMSKIVEILVTASVEQAICVFPIVGMGGVGKTTVARKVFNNDQVVNHFEKRIWVSVSLNFNPVTLFKMILESLTGENVHAILTREAVMEKIQQVLASKTYLIVLDDVWNEEFEKWEDFICALSGVSSTMGNVIIVTTRKGNIAAAVETLPTHRLESLSKDECWSIIKTKACLEEVVPIEYENIGKSLARRCGGLPLAAKVLGSLLRGKSKDEWLLILRNQLLDLGQEENLVNKILKLSYDQLPSSSLKRCFAYCCIFPQDSVLFKQELIELWMAEGYLQDNQENDLEVMGDIIFNHLLQASLFQDAFRDIYGNVTSCKMHDLVHDLASSVTGCKSISEKGNGNDTHKFRYLCSDDPCDFSTELAKFLRTCIINCKVARRTFSGFSCLRSLTLMDSNVTELPMEICDLIHLRLLDISGTTIKYLPDSVGKLSYLQTLCIPNFLRLPNTITDLVSLRHLHGIFIQLLPGMGKLTSLRTLWAYQVGLEKGCGIEELGYLKNLSKCLDIGNLEKVKNKEEAKLADLFAKTNIFCLNLHWKAESRESETNDEYVLEGLQPHSKLKELKIYGYRGKNFPLWTTKMKVLNDMDKCWAGLNTLVDIKLINCDLCEEIPRLGHLPCLKFLELSRLQNVRVIGLSFYGFESYSTSNPSNNVNMQETRIAFPALQRLYLDAMLNLTEWEDVERTTTTFPRVEDLRITNCPGLKSVPDRFIGIKVLNITNWRSSVPLINLCNSLETLRIENMQELIHLPDELLVNNQNLSNLSIKDCPKLIHLLPRLIEGRACLRDLSIHNCENLRELPDDLSTLQLKSLCVSGCPVLQSIKYPRGRSRHSMSISDYRISHCQGLTNFQCELLEPCSSLITFALNDVENLVNLDGVIPSLSRMSGLIALRLYNLSKLTKFPTEISCLRSLQDLTIGGFSDSLSFDLFYDHFGQILLVHHSLKYLSLIGKEYWDSLPDQIQHLTALQHLGIRDFGIESLPEWLGNLPSLTVLSISNCQRLLHMPSRTSMRRLTKLSRLSFMRCPRMKERCSNQKTEWPKISHIRTVSHD